MILPLHQRGVDSIAEFEQAAKYRFAEASVLDKRSRKLGAVYLYGYSVEMRVKAAYFHNAGFSGRQIITDIDRNNAIGLWSLFGLLARPGQHDILGWAPMVCTSL